MATGGVKEIVTLRGEAFQVENCVIGADVCCKLLCISAGALLFPARIEEFN